MEESDEVPLCAYCDQKLSGEFQGGSFCSRECSTAHETERSIGLGRRREVCEKCGGLFTCAGSGVKVCHACRGRRAGAVAKKPKQRKIGRYVYGWFDDDELFYVGRGVDRRDVLKHKTSNGNWPAECQQRRDRLAIEGRTFTSVVFRDNLTDEGAALVEAVLIDLFQPACNVVKGMSRQERPPLELPPDIVTRRLAA